jgi:hypothetical protein
MSIDQKSLGECTSRRNECEKLKLSEARRARSRSCPVSIDQETRVNRSSKTFRNLKSLREFQLRVERPEARRVKTEVNLNRQIQRTGGMNLWTLGKDPKRIWTIRSRGYVATDRELRVKTLWENTKEKSLKSSKPEQPKQLGVIDLKEDTCHQIVNSG